MNRAKATTRALVLLLMLSVAFALIACGSSQESEDPNIDSEATTAETQIDAESKSADQGEETPGEARLDSLVMEIDGADVPVRWENNDSTKAIAALAAKEPLTIEMSAYQDFEQVGDIGAQIPAEDKNMTTSPGDIVLYAEDQLVIFFGSNTWDYTKLGIIEGMTEEELSDMLDKEKVTVRLGVE